MQSLLRLSLLIFLILPGPIFAATFTVTTNADSGAGSLRAAITAANANAGLDTIAFSIGAGGPQVIDLASALPDISDAVIIDGTTQPGFVGTPMITLDGRGRGTSGSGLTIASAASSTIRGLVIVDFGASGIEILSGGATIVGNYIGVDASGSVAKGNQEGIRVLSDVDGNVIGGPAAADGNVISGNRGGGILFWGGAISDGASDDNIIRGNIIGLDATGLFAVGNVGGISIRGGERNRIGGTAPGEGNIVSGNVQHGIEIHTGFSETSAFDAADNVLQGNLIGTNITGTAVVPNGSTGVSIAGARATVFGGSAPGARNIVSGNGEHGVVVGLLCSGNLTTCFPSEDTVIEGNLIGTDADGMQDFGNGLTGVFAGGVRATEIRGNVISGNGGRGIFIVGSSGFGEAYPNLDTVVVSNLIGTNSTGTAAVANDEEGILTFDSRNGIFGGPGAERNVISGNRGSGIAMTGGFTGTFGHVIRGNLIGTAIDGITALGNGGDGVLFTSDDPAKLTGHVVGGTGAGEGNVIWFNGQSGITSQPSRGNQFLGNSIDHNAALGIDLFGGSVTPNDPLDLDEGPNDLQNYPVLTSATVIGSTRVKGVFNSTPLRTFRVEFFSSPAADPTGYGEGRTFLGFMAVTTDEAGNAGIAATLPAVAIGSVITATATDLTLMNTSEFSNAVAAAAAAQLNVTDVEVIEGSSGNAAAVFTVSLTSPSAEDVAFQYVTANETATAPGDYTSTSGSGAIPAGALSTTISIPVHGDTVAEGDETFVVNISGVTGAIAGDVDGQATIVNDDVAVATAPIPTASEWALIAMALLLALAGANAVRP